MLKSSWSDISRPAGFSVRNLQASQAFSFRIRTPRIPLELGGDNAIENLWPEPEGPGDGFRQKDRVEHYLHREVCRGAMTLRDAQRAIATDWLSVLRQVGAEHDRGRRGER